MERNIFVSTQVKDIISRNEWFYRILRFQSLLEARPHRASNSEGVYQVSPNLTQRPRPPEPNLFLWSSALVFLHLTGRTGWCTDSFHELLQASRGFGVVGSTVASVSLWITMVWVPLSSPFCRHWIPWALRTQLRIVSAVSLSPRSHKKLKMIDCQH